MKKNLVIIFILLGSNFFVFSQSLRKNIEAQLLERKILVLYQQGKLDDAIQLTEKVLTLTKNFPSVSSADLATAHYNTALLRKKRFQRDNKRISNEKLSLKELRKLWIQNRQDRKVSEKKFWAVIRIHKKVIRMPSLQLADAQTELAWLLFNPVKHYTIDIRDGIRLKRAEKLYSESIKLRESLLGKDSDEVISSVFSFAEFYTSQSYFEKAIPLYERFVAAIGKKHGKSKMILLPALRSLANIFVTTNNPSVARKFLVKISKITGKKEALPEPNIVLNKRLVNFRNWRTRDFRKHDYFDLSRLPASVVPRFYKDTRKYKYKRVLVKIISDASGNIISVEAKHKIKKLRKNAEKEVRTWKLKPFMHDGQKKGFIGYLIYYGTVGPKEKFD